MKKNEKIRRMKKIIAWMLACSLVTAAAPELSEAANVPGLSQKKIIMRKGTTRTLRVSGRQIVSVKWKSSRPAVVRVNQKGVLRARQIGKATITAKVTVRKRTRRTVKSLKASVTVKAAVASAHTPSVDVTATAYLTTSAVPEKTVVPGLGIKTPETTQASGTQSESPKATEAAGTQSEAPKATEASGTQSEAPKATEASGTQSEAPKATEAAGTQSEAPKVTQAAGTETEAPETTEAPEITELPAPVDVLYEINEDHTVTLTEIANPASLGAVVVLPATVAGMTVTSIGSNFMSSNKTVEQLVIPEGIQTIGDSAFFYCTSLKEVTIPDSVTELAGYCFYGCSALQEITIPDGVTKLGNCCLAWCENLNAIHFGTGLREIGVYVFEGCNSLTALEIPDDRMSAAF